MDITRRIAEPLLIALIFVSASLPTAVDATGYAIFSRTWKRVAAETLHFSNTKETC
jgi:hypothetical protein